MKIFLKPLLLLLPLLAGLFMMNSCHKEQFSTNGALSFSADTLTFDTVFTTLGSTTKYFLIRNNQSKSLNISDIKLMQLAGTQFRINVDGTPGTEFKNIDVPAHDSLYVFVEVTINPNANNSPFIVLDQIQFITNGITQKVVLEAMGQNAYYHFSENITGNTIWKSDKPHIIVNKNGGLPILEITQGATLNIPPKCEIYMGPNAVITVDGTLNARGGDWADSIVFQYIRTDYPGQPGQYLGITYSRTATVNMDHVIIDQSTFGLSDEYVLDILAQAQITTSNLKTYNSSPVPTVKLDKVIIRNASSTAMTSLATNLTATNSLFHSSSGQMIILGLGGNYTLNNCTMANGYSQYVNHQNASLTVTDYLQYIDKTGVGPYMTIANINNTIVVGPLQNELAFSNSGGSTLNVAFQNCVLTTIADSFHVIQPSDNGCIYTNGDPQYLQPALFMNPYKSNYMPDSGSLVFNKGNSTQPDLYDYSRSSNPCIGAIQWHQ